MRLLASTFLLFAALSMAAPPARAQNVLIGPDLDWWKIDPNMVTFLCLPDRKPAWCGDAEAGVRPPPPEPPPPPRERRRRGEPPPPPPPPPKSVSDDDWRGLVDEMARRGARTTELVTMERRAFEDGDADAFELLGYIYATGRGPTRDYAAAYQYYGLALVGGKAEVRTNLDQIWPFMDEAEQRFVRFRFERAFPRP